MSEGGGGYTHRGGTPVAPRIGTGLTRSKAASGEGTQTGHVSVKYRPVFKKVDTAACIDTGLNTEQMKAPGTGSDT